MGSALEALVMCHLVRPTPDLRRSLVDLLADHDDRLLAAYVNDEQSISYQRL